MKRCSTLLALIGLATLLYKVNSSSSSLRQQQQHVNNWRSFRAVFDHYRSRPKNITCPELNVTFTNDPPFDVLGVPECGDSVQPKLVLYLPNSDISCELRPDFLPNNDTSLCFEALRARTEVARLVFVIHGFLKSFSTIWLHEIKDDIQAVDANTAVILVGWGHGVRDIFSYWRAASNTRYIAYVMYTVTKEMHRIVARSMYVHCAGHSLGGQACGLAGKLLIVDPDQHSKEFDRISGMDPAGPLFCNDVPYPFDFMNITPTARLGPHDAKLVDVIHTDGDARYLGILPQYGTMERLGSVDFYPGSHGYYGHDQPGCLDFINIISCSHSRARELFQSSIRTEVCLASRECQGNPHLIPANCYNVTKAVAMGYWWDTTHPTLGMYTVEELSHLPYCGRESLP